MEEPAREDPEDKPSDSNEVDAEVDVVSRKDRWCEGKAPEPQRWNPETFAAPLRHLRRQDRLATEEESSCGTFIGDHLRASPNGEAEVGGVQTFSEVVLLPRPKRRNGSENSQETLASKSVDGGDHVPTGGHPHMESVSSVGASCPEKGSSSSDQTSSHSFPSSTAETESVGSAMLSCDLTSVPIIRRIGGSRPRGRTPSRGTKSSSNNRNSDMVKSECSLHVPADFQAPGAQEEASTMLLRTRGFQGESRGQTSDKITGGLSLPVPKPRGKKRLSGSFPDAFAPPESGSDGSKQKGPLDLPIPLPRTKKRLSGAFSDSGSSTKGLGVLLQGEPSIPSELEKQVSAAMAEEFPDKNKADEVSDTWTDEKDLVSGTATGAAQDDWLHVRGGEDNETKEEELDFGFVSVGGPASSGRVQR